MMRALVTTGCGLKLEEAVCPDPIPGPHETLIEVRAASLNRGYLRRIRQSISGTIPGYDVAGVDGAGRRVFGLVRQGGLATLVSVRRDWLAEVPDSVDFRTAACLPVAFVTALQALRDLARVRKGDRVLVVGAAGGVGVAAVQLARHLGARVVGLASTRERADAVRALGADEVLLKMDPRRAFDVILESAGGSSLSAAIQSVAPNGKVVCLGSSSDQVTAFDPRILVLKNVSLLGYLLFESPWSKKIGRDLSWLADEVAEERLQVPIAGSFPFRRATEALRLLEARSVIGKLVLEPQ